MDIDRLIRRAIAAALRTELEVVGDKEAREPKLSHSCGGAVTLAFIGLVDKEPEDSGPA